MEGLIINNTHEKAKLFTDHHFQTIWPILTETEDIIEIDNFIPYQSEIKKI